MMLTQSNRISPLFLMKSQQDCFDLVAGLYGFLMGFEAVIETPDGVVKQRVIPLKASDLTIP
jgi:hypothetical protein